MGWNIVYQDPVVPAWVSEISADSTWINIGSNSMLSVSDDPTEASNLTYGLTKAWIGAAVEQTRKEMVIPLPGGHGARTRSDLYAFRFNQDEPAWVRLRVGTTGGTGTDAANVSGLNGSGEPTATHTYHRPVCAGGHIWLPTLDSISDNTNGYWTTTVVSYPLDQAEASWRLHGRLITGSIGKWLGGSACYDSVTDRIFTFPQACDVDPPYYINVSARLAGDDVAYPGACPNTGTLALTGTSIYNVTAVAEDLRLLIFLSQAGSLQTYNLDNLGAGNTDRTMSGTQIDPYGGGFVYHPGTRKIYGLDAGASGNTLRVLDIPTTLSNTWAWRTVSTSGVTLPQANADPPTNGDNSCFSRFNIIHDMGDGRAYLCYYPRYTHVGMYVMRLPLAGL